MKKVGKRRRKSRRRKKEKNEKKKRKIEVQRDARRGVVGDINEYK